MREQLARLRNVSFQTKVLVPVVTVMVLLVAMTMWFVNGRLDRQFKADAAQALETANAVFQGLRADRSTSLRLRFQNIASEPRYRAACYEADAKTLQDLLNKLLGQESGGDLVQYKKNSGEVVASARRDPTLNQEEYERRCEASANQAISGMANADTIQVSGRLFDVVSVPVKMPTTDEIIGVLTFGVEIGGADARKLSELTGSGIVLVVGGAIAASSLEKRGLFEQCVELFDNSPTAFSAPRKSSRRHEGSYQDIVIPQDHFRVSVGRFASLSGDPGIGYVLLRSYQDALQELKATQRTLVAASLIGIILSTWIVWLLIRSVTQPLRELRDSAEAVGQGDFSRRVKVSSQDECGKLADVFNRMTENLDASHAQLNETVDTLKTTQAQLIQREKLSAIGEFVAGVTHELNNPLTSLLGFSELLAQTPVSEPQGRFIKRIAQSATRCQKIVQSLLSFTRKHKPERKSASLNDLVEATLEIMAYEMRTSNIQVSTQLDRSLPAVWVDAHQIQQVFLNIVNNARQAMEGCQSKGLLSVKSESRPGRVRVTFQDNGPGMPEENLSKIFDPFFTTKEAGKGTGLGMSLSYGIVRDHGGSISVQSKLGEGARFDIELPLSAARDGTQTSAEPVARIAPMRDGRGRRVLVVDDEEAILDLANELLSGDGYVVDTASDGETAMSQLRDHKYDLTICDWKMPGLNGRYLYEHLSQENPQAASRLIFMTGDVVNESTRCFLEEHHKVCLAKPFSLEDFRVAISKLAPAA